MIHCFDTSGINRLLDDPEREPILAAILSAGSFRITAFNVVEAAKAKDAHRRACLIELMKRLADGKRPLDRPNTILLNYADAHAAGASAAPVNADENLDGLWIALNQPEMVDEEARNEVLTWASRLEDDFSGTVAADRDQFQALFRRAPLERPNASGATLRAYLNKKEQCRSLIGNVYERRTGKQLTDPGYLTLVREPVWALYFLGYAYAVHKRAIQEHNFSGSRNAGAIDLAQAVYLTLCDRFVTDDRAQYRGLRLLNVLKMKRHTQVMRYDTFRSRLLVFA
jgi:hypothetical protein